MKKTVEINGLRLYCRHGVMAQEQKVGNTFEVTVRFSYPFDDSDSLHHAINYAEVVEVVKQVMNVPAELLETLVIRLRSALLEAFPKIDGGYIRVAKLVPPIPGAELSSVAAAIEW